MTAPALPTAPLVPHTPSKPETRGAATSVSQRDRRFTDTFYDTYKHARFPNGRPFTGQREFQSGSATESIAAGFLSSDLQCGEFYCDNPDMGQTPQERAATLASAWIAPWLPPGGKKYMQFNYRRKLITFDYAKGELDERQSLNTYYRAAAKLAGANGWGEIQFNVMPSYQVTSVMGEPTKFLPIWQAARAGDPWLMGAIDEPNEALAKILGLDVHYLGSAHAGFSDREVVSVQRAAPGEPLITPEKVMATPIEQLAALVAKLSDDVQALRAERAPVKKRSHHKSKVAATVGA